MKHPFDIIEELRATNGTNDKIDILKANKSNELLQYVLKMTYDNTYNYYMTIPPKVDQGIKGHNSLIFGMELLLDQIASRKVTGNAAKSLVKDTITNMNLRDREVMSLIIKRDLKCGISAKTIAKVWPDLLPKNPYMRCGGKEKDIKYPVLTQLKCDGIFLRVIVEGGTVTAKTRNGNVLLLDNMQEGLKDELSKLPEAVYEGELLVYYGGTALPRELGNGIINGVLISGKSALGEDEEFKLVLWDTLSLKEFSKGKSSMTVVDRFDELRGDIPPDSKHIAVVDYKILNNKEEVYEYYSRVLARGEEGLVLKNTSGIWKDGTSKDLIKLKVERVVELSCVDFLPAKEGSKNADTFGSILCESSCGELQVACTGIPDNIRKLLWVNRDYYKGKPLSVKANGIMFSDDTTKKKHSLFLPRFEGFRDYDKREADDFEYIKSVFL